ncbi:MULTISPECIES: hypothetical protein [unclassified Nonomuraea]|uniref:hypothetical protein n=1 Tax=unclassified Nonomuraea TaxID=2593643 RepID=UPI0033E9205A
MIDMRAPAAVAASFARNAWSERRQPGGARSIHKPGKQLAGQKVSGKTFSVDNFPVRPEGTS